MTTSRITKLLKTLCATGGVKVEEILKEAEAIGIDRKYTEENLGMLASEGFVKISHGIVTMGK